MAITQVTNESWFSRLGKSIGGIFAGILLFLLGIGVLAWNEGRAVKTAKGLEEGAANVVSLASPTAAAAEDGKLIHITGEATTTDRLKDDFFPIDVVAIKLRRDVEMLQWKENSESKTQNKLGGGTETVTTYTYEKTWSNQAINSGDFKEPTGHENPGTIPIPSQTQTAQTVTIGDFRLSGGLVGAMTEFTGVPLPETLPEGFQKFGDSIYKGVDPMNPQIGDLKIKFDVSNPAEVSIIAKVNGKNLVGYPTQTGTTIEMLRYGSVPASEMFAAAQASNETLTWVLRVVGFFMLFIGVSLVLAPIAVIADVLPILGSIMRFGTSIIAMVIAAPTALITIALAWLAYRPILGISLLVLGVAVPVLIVMFKKAKPAPVAALLLGLVLVAMPGGAHASQTWEARVLNPLVGSATPRVQVEAAMLAENYGDRAEAVATAGKAPKGDPSTWFQRVTKPGQMKKLLKSFEISDTVKNEVLSRMADHEASLISTGGDSFVVLFFQKGRFVSFTTLGSSEGQ